MSKLTHTPEPWEVRKHNGTNFYGARGENNDWFIFENALEKDAARIVACVNACKGMYDPESVISLMKSIRVGADCGPDLGHLLADYERLRARVSELEEQLKRNAL